MILKMLEKYYCSTAKPPSKKNGTSEILLSLKEQGITRLSGW